MLTAIFISVFAVPLVWLGAASFLYVREQRAVRTVVDRVDEAQLEEVFRLIEQIGTVAQRGRIGLFRKARQPTGRLCITLPCDLEDFPWAGKVVDAEIEHSRSENTAKFTILDQPTLVEMEAQPEIRWLAIPAIQIGAKNKIRNIFSIERYLALSPSLNDLMSRLYPKDPKQLLAHILSTDHQHPAGERFDQLRCGTPPGWIQSEKFKKCPLCRRPMRLILQVPGGLLGKRTGEACFYLFGCSSHPDHLIVDEDWG